MRYYRVLALFALVLSALLGACGRGGGGMFNLSLKANPAATATEHRISFLPAPQGQGLKRDVKYSFNFSSFPCVDGLKLSRS
jgi:hypothetical protein